MKHEVVLCVTLIFICFCSSILVVLLSPQNGNLWLLQDHTWQVWWRGELDTAFWSGMKGISKLP